MKEKLKNIIAYIFRGWEDEPGYTHSRIKIFPPFFFDLISYFIVLVILYKIGLYLWGLI